MIIAATFLYLYNVSFLNIGLTYVSSFHTYFKQFLSPEVYFAGRIYKF